MPIVVVCRSCHQRFKVSEKFAGRKGPCPKCKEPIEIPKVDEQVEIHTPEHSEGGARGKSGQLVLEPIARQETRLSVWIVAGVAVAALLVLITAWLLKGSQESVKRTAAAIGLLLVTPPLVLAGYTFLRNDELEPYKGAALWIRVGICSAVYIGCWVIYSFVPGEWTDEFYKWMFLGPAFSVAGATAAFACFDLDFASGFFHFAFYVGVTLLLGMMMGMQFIG